MDLDSLEGGPKPPREGDQESQGDQQHEDHQDEDYNMVDPQAAENKDLEDDDEAQPPETKSGFQTAADDARVRFRNQIEQLDANAASADPDVQNADMNLQNLKRMREENTLREQAGVELDEPEKKRQKILNDMIQAATAQKLIAEARAETSRTCLD